MVFESRKEGDVFIFVPTGDDEPYEEWRTSKKDFDVHCAALSFFSTLTTSTSSTPRGLTAQDMLCYVRAHTVLAASPNSDHYKG